MNTRKTIYNKLFSEKTELAKHEVELSLISEMSKSYDLVLSNIVNLEKRLDDILKAENSAGDVKNTLVKQYDQFSNIKNEVIKSFKELGLDYNTSKYKADNEKIAERMQSVMNSYSKLISKI